MLVGVVLIVGYGIIQLLTSSITSKVGLDYQAGKIESQSNSAFSTSSSTSRNNRFAARRIAIMQADEHPALELVVDQLRKDLLELDYVDEVDVFVPEETPEFGGRLYDAYLTLSIVVDQDSKPLLGRDFKATVRLTAGTLPYKSHSSYTDSLSPPEVGYLINGEIEHTSRSTQIGTPYKLIADDIGKMVSDHLAKQYNDWYEAHGLDTDWPADLIGEYSDGAAIPWPEGVTMEKVVDGVGLMRPRHALWAIETNDPQTLMHAFYQTYEQAGWRIGHGAVIEPREGIHERFHFRVWNGDAHVVEVFEMRDPLGERKPGEISRICVRYQHRFDQSQVQSVIDRLLEDGANIDVVGYLSDMMDSAQLERYYTALAASQPSDPAILVDMAKYSHGKGRSDEARQHLIRAKMLAARMNAASDVTKSIKEAAVEAGIEPIEEPPLTKASLAAYGYKPLEGLVGVPLTVKIYEPLLVYYESDGELNTIDLWLAPVSGTPGLFVLNDYERFGGGGRGWTSGGGSLSGGQNRVSRSFDRGGGAYYVTYLQRLDDDTLFDVEVVETPKP